MEVLRAQGRTSAVVAEQAAGAVRNSSFMPQNKGYVGDAGGVEALLDTLRAHAGTLSVATQVAWALAVVTSANVPNQRRFTAAGGVAVVADVERRHRADKTLLEQCNRVLVNVGAQQQR